MSIAFFVFGTPTPLLQMCFQSELALHVQNHFDYKFCPLCGDDDVDHSHFDRCFWCLNISDCNHRVWLDPLRLNKLEDELEDLSISS